MIITHLVSLTMYFVSSSCSHKTHCLTLELFHSISQTLRQVITKPAFLEAYACMYGHWRKGHTTFVNLPIWHAISKDSLSTYRHMNTILLSSSFLCSTPCISYITFGYLAINSHFEIPFLFFCVMCNIVDTRNGGCTVLAWKALNTITQRENYQDTLIFVIKMRNKF